jgi:hypothetical protein
MAVAKGCFGGRVMALIRCSFCGKASLNATQKCQFCGTLLKSPGIWKRKLRRKEAYGFLLLLTGSLILMVLKAMGIPLVVLGIVLIAYSILTPRWSSTSRSAEIHDVHDVSSDRFTLML